MKRKNTTCALKFDTSKKSMVNNKSLHIIIDEMKNPNIVLSNAEWLFKVDRKFAIECFKTKSADPFTHI